MLRLGLIGGMSWESSALYYRLINEGVAEALGGLHSADCLLLSVDFARVETMQAQGLWEEAAALLAAAARDLQAGGAEVLVLCTNTMHKVAEQIEAAVDIPLLHLADATAKEAQAQGMERVGLLGTAFTMEQDFYVSRLRSHGLDVIVPNAADRSLVHRVIYDELCLGEVRSESRQEYLRIITGLAGDGADGVILGCTEIELLVSQEDCPVPLLPTTRLHAAAAVRHMLGSR